MTSIMSLNPTTKFKLCTYRFFIILRELLKAVYDNIVVIKPQQSREDRYLHLHIRPDLEAAYAKLYCWKLIEFTKCVFLDADTIVSFSFYLKNHLTDMIIAQLYIRNCIEQL